MTSTEQNLNLIESSIRSVADYPKLGILFRDVTGLLENPKAYQAAIDILTEHYRDKGITKVAGTEARGFLFGAPVALALGLGFVPVRKAGKLPGATYRQEYQLEYGTDALEIQQDAINSQDKVLVVDDLLATGGTVAATASLIRHAGGSIQDAAFIINLFDLEGAKKLASLGIDCFSLLNFPGH